MNRSASLAVLSTAILAACTGGDSATLGPRTYDGAGVLPCSAGTPDYDGACGYRVVRDDAGGAEIWISNIAIPDRASYRVLTFSQGEFTAADGTALEVGRTGRTWMVSIPGAEYYQIGDAVVGI